MTQQVPTDEELMAFADGALDAASMERIARLVANDPELAATVEMYRKSAERVREVRDALDAEPVPDALRQSIETMIASSTSPTETLARPPAENVLSFRPRQPAASPPRQRVWAMPMAAALLAVVGGVVGYMAGRDVTGSAAPSLAAVGEALPAAVGSVLASSASGSEVTLAEGRLRMISTVRSKSGNLCREFELDTRGGLTIVGVGCHEADAWRLDIAVAAPRTDEGFAPASSLNAIDSYLEMIEASGALSPEEEAEALSSIH